MATDEQKDFAAAVERHMNAWNTSDIDMIAEFESDWKGFGYRTFPVRNFGKMTKDQYYQHRHGFSDVIKNFEATFQTEYSEVIGNVGVIGGFLTEKFTTNSGRQVEVKIRSTSTYLKSDGKWRLIQRHQDIQQFKNPNQNLSDFLAEFQ